MTTRSQRAARRRSSPLAVRSPRAQVGSRIRARAACTPTSSVQTARLTSNLSSWPPSESRCLLRRLNISATTGERQAAKCAALRDRSPPPPLQWRQQVASLCTGARAAMARGRRRRGSRSPPALGTARRSRTPRSSLLSRRRILAARKSAIESPFANSRFIDVFDRRPTAAQAAPPLLSKHRRPRPAAAAPRRAASRRHRASSSPSRAARPQPRLTA